MSYGYKVSRDEYSTVDTFCENKGIDVLIWNAEEFMFGNAPEAELEFESEQDRNTVREFVVQLRRTEAMLV